MSLKRLIASPFLPPVVRIGAALSLSDSESDELCRQVTDRGTVIVEEECPGDPASSLAALGRCFGGTIDHRLSDAFGVHPIRHLEGFPQYANTTAAALELHTDGSFEPCTPKVMLIACERPCPLGGGLTRLAFADIVWRELMLIEPQALSGLFRPDALRIVRDDRSATKPVFSWTKGLLHLVYRSGRDISVVVHPDAREGFEAIGRVLSDSAHQIEFLLRSGQTLVVDNTRVLHGRTAFPSSSLRALHGLWCDGKDSRLTLGLSIDGQPLQTSWRAANVPGSARAEERRQSEQGS